MQIGIVVTSVEGLISKETFHGPPPHGGKGNRITEVTRRYGRERSQNCRVSLGRHRKNNRDRIVWKDNGQLILKRTLRNSNLMTQKQSGLTILSQYVSRLEAEDTTNLGIHPDPVPCLVTHKFPNTTNVRHTYTNIKGWSQQRARTGRRHVRSDHPIPPFDTSNFFFFFSIYSNYPTMGEVL